MYKYIVRWFGGSSKVAIQQPTVRDVKLFLFHSVINND